MEKLNYILKRFLQMIPVLIIGVILVFALVRFLPGDTAIAMLGDKVPPEVLEAYREKMGLNDSIFTQFWVYCQSLFHLDLGMSTQYHMPVADLLGSRLQVTVLLTLMAALMTVVPPGKIVGGSVRYNGEELTTLTDRQLRGIRGSEIGMIFQDPMTALNPVMKIKDQIYESLCKQGLSKKEMFARGVELLRLVDIPEPEKRMNEYVHQFSGGMRQRVMIAITLAANPKLLIADEASWA